ncbi:MAG: nucleoside hydrolase [Salinirussus sp.]
MDTDSPRRLIVDTDTAGDDTQALAMAATSDRIALEGVTICAGNVEFDYQVENAKYTLDLVDAGDVTVYEGARSPLQKEFEHADYVHGEGGLGGNLFPETGTESGDRHAVEYIVETARENPGELTLACIAPLTNVALALSIEPDLGELLDEVWVMGGSVNWLGNVTPAAEYNFWVDPDAASIVIDAMDVTLVDWGLIDRDATFDPETIERIERGPDTPLTEFFGQVTAQVRQFNREQLGTKVITQPDSALMAALVDPSIVDETGTYHVAVDEREGLTRGYSAVDELGVTDGTARTRVVESMDEQAFRDLFVEMLFEGSPDGAL